MEQNQLQAQEEARAVPWSVLDTWVGVGLLALINAGLLVGLFLFRAQAEQLVQGAGLILAELIYLLPVLLIFGWRRISFGSLGFTKFDSATMGLGCGLLIAAYGIVVAHNLLLMLLGVDTQGEAIFKALSELENPAWLLIVGVLVAPLVEEIFFRGFLFQGFRQRYGWIPALVLSSVIFAAAHLDPVSFIPTFVLGAVMAYVYHRSNSIWPGILLHFLNNGFALCATLAATQIPGVIPS